MIVKNKLAAGALALSLFATPIVAVQAASTSDTSEALADCLYKHATASDKLVLVQWAYVTLSKTSAAKQIQTIPSAKVCLLYTSPSPRDRQKSRMPSSA